jgi:glycosyltransferase involved in cell wall biosynthesis
MNPAVSIIIPVYNRATMVKEAIASALAASPSVPLEVIVIDDASTDETWNVISAYAEPVRALRMEKNGGQVYARNRGLDVARGKYVKYLDSDDLLEPAHLALEVDVAEREQADIVVSGWRSLGRDGRMREIEAPRFNSVIDDVLDGKAVPVAAALYARDRDWRWNPAFRKLDDWEYFTRAALDVTKIGTAPGVSFEWRDHAGPRATHVTMLKNAEEHHQILDRVEQRLAAMGELTDARKRRLAQYFYKELRVLCLTDRAAFERAVTHIYELDARFHPGGEERQWYMRLAARLLGTRRAVLLHTAFKKLIRRG